MTGRPRSRGVVALLDRGIEGVEIGMEDGRLGHEQMFEQAHVPSTRFSASRCSPARARRRTRASRGVAKRHDSRGQRCRLARARGPAAPQRWGQHAHRVSPPRGGVAPRGRASGGTVARWPRRWGTTSCGGYGSGGSSRSSPTPATASTASSPRSARPTTRRRSSSPATRRCRRSQAVGYAKFSGKVGVCMATSRPGRDPPAQRPLRREARPRAGRRDRRADRAQRDGRLLPAGGRPAGAAQGRGERVPRRGQRARAAAAARSTAPSAPR